MNEKKVVSRRLFIALEIVCIILIACLVGATSSYSWQINNKNNTISSLNSQIASLNTQISDQNNTISSLRTHLAILQNQISNIHIVSTVNSTVGTENSIVWAGNQTRNIAPDTGAAWGPFYPNSAGYVLVLVSSSNNSTYVQVLNQISNSVIVGYDRKIQVGFNGTAVFPILSGPVFVEVGDSLGEATITVSAIYCY